jgi:exodeoxyribonuclease VII small subunit
MPKHETTPNLDTRRAAQDAFDPPSPPAIRDLDPGAGPTAKSSAEGLSDAGPAPVGFEQALAELETIVAQMESGELTLEQSLAAYKRGAALLQYCQSALKDAQQQVKLLESGVLQDFRAADSDDE